MDTKVDAKPLRIPRPKLAGRELLAKTPLPDYDDPPGADKSYHHHHHHHHRSSGLKGAAAPGRMVTTKEDKA